MKVENPYPGLTVRWMLVSVATAAKWLKGNTQNRPLRAAWVAQLCHDIATSNFGLSDSAIVIAKDGTILNGQHRLEAIIASQTPLWQVVVTNVPIECIFDMDQGKVRPFADAYNLRHAKNGRMTTPKIVATAVAAFLRNPFIESSKVAPTRHDIHQLYELHGEAINWITDNTKVGAVRGITVAPVLGPICRAFYHARKNNQLTRLAEFINVLTTGEANGPKDQAAIKLRNAIFAMDKGAGTAGSRGNRETLYRKTEIAILAFLKGEKINSMRMLDKEAFAVPHE